MKAGIKLRTGLLVLAALLLMNALTFATASNLSISFIDVGQGDSIFIKSPSGKAMLVDGGPQAAGSIVGTFLKSRGVSLIDILVSTHPHEDHIGGLPNILGGFKVGRVYDSGFQHTTNIFETYLTAIDRLNIPFNYGRAGQVLDLGNGVKAQVLWPKETLWKGINDSSIVIRLTYGSISVLLTGDISTAVESMLKIPQTTILKVAHHGSRYSTGKAFLKAVKPKVSIISVGAGNNYGHPAQETLDRLKKSGSVIYRTDWHGTITIDTNGKTYKITTTKTPQITDKGKAVKAAQYCVSSSRKI